MPRVLINRTLLVIPAITLGLMPAVASAQVTSPGWRRFATISVPSAAAVLFGAGVADRAHAWAVGFSVRGNTAVPLVAAWNGSGWTRVTLPAAVVAKLGQNPPFVVAAPGPRDVWAFTATGQWLHGVRGGWSAGALTSTPVVVASALAIGGTAWAFGAARGPNGVAVPYVSRNAGTGWQRMPVPGTGLVVAAGAVTQRDIWAVVDSGPVRLAAGVAYAARHLGVVGSAVPRPSSSLVHWFAGRWHKVASLPSMLRGASLISILARTDRNILVGGGRKNAKDGTTETVGHWNGHRWIVVTMRARATAVKFHMTSMVADGQGGVWALGLCTGSPSCFGNFRLWHQTAGKWGHAVTPRLGGRFATLVTLTSAGRSVWGAGVVVGHTGAGGLIALWGSIP